MALDLDLRLQAPIALAAALAVGPGEALAILGPSGAGKSTLLRAIAGFRTAVAGHVRVNGSSWFDAAAGVNLPAHRRRVGFMFQSYALFPHRTAAENVMEALLDHPPSERVARAQAVLREVHLEGYGRRFPRELSGGQQQRVALARALARAPEVLLLDEPFSAVDRPTRRALADTILELKANRRLPILLVTHDMEDARRIADRLLVLAAGRVLQQGRLADVLANPADDEVAGLIA